MNILHGKEIDIRSLKKPVLSDLVGHLAEIQNIVNSLKENETEIRQDKCYICGNQARRKRLEAYGFTYFECNECSLYYTGTRFSDAAIERFYENNEYWSKITYGSEETYRYRRDFVAKPKVEFVERYKEIGSGSWLDVGAGIGDLISVVQEKGGCGVGLELSRASVEFGKKMFGVSLIRQTLERFVKNAEEKSFDVISFIGLLEHVTDPISYLNIAHSLLKQDGCVLIQVPNAESVATQVQGVFPENIFRHMSPIEHIMVFTRRSLFTALKLTGFEPIALWYHGLDIYELLNSLTLVNERMSGSPLEETFIEHNNELQQVIDDLELSDRLICLARKEKD
jgi:2-polyprenyl-3-methyl-5-hydroxy-6-metoxy-1,4-benzoquinol methylase